MRLFVALDIPDSVRAAIHESIEKWRPLSRQARWVRLEGMHITLKFIGEVAAEKLDPIEAALASIRSPHAIPIQYRGVGFFPNAKRPRVLWAGIAADAALGDLAAAVGTALEPLGISREQRAFSPHLTLARFDPAAAIDRLQDAVAAAGPLEFGQSVASEFHLYESALKRGGAEYTRLATYRMNWSIP